MDSRLIYFPLTLDFPSRLVLTFFFALLSVMVDAVAVRPIELVELTELLEEEEEMELELLVAVLVLM